MAIEGRVWGLSARRAGVRTAAERQSGDGSKLGEPAAAGTSRGAYKTTRASQAPSSGSNESS